MRRRLNIHEMGVAEVRISLGGLQFNFHIPYVQIGIPKPFLLFGLTLQALKLTLSPGIVKTGVGVVTSVDQLRFSISKPRSIAIFCRIDEVDVFLVLPGRDELTEPDRVRNIWSCRCKAELLL